MADTRLSTMEKVIFIVALYSVLVTGLLAESSETTEKVLRHPSGYHITALKQSVDRIKRSWDTTPRSHVFKRSTDSNADDLLLSTLASYCTNFQADPKISNHFQQVEDKKPLHKRDISGFTRYKSNRETDDKGPTVFPVKISSQRKDDKVWVILEIAHSDTVLISRIDPHNSQESILEMPKEVICQQIVSTVRFEIESFLDQCGTDKAIYELTPKDNNQFTITIVVDLCLYDHSFSFNYNYHGSLKPMRSESVSFPSFRMVPDPGQFILIESGQASTFDLVVNFTSPSTQFSIDLSLWDWNSETIRHSTAQVTYLRHRTPRFQVETTNYDQEEILQAHITSDNTDIPATVTLRVSFNEGFGNESGKMHFIYTKHYIGSYPYKSKIIPRVVLERTLDIKLVGRPRAFPEDLIYLSPQKRFLCDEKGNRIQDPYMGFGTNCTVRCLAFGRDVTSLYITKLGPIKSPVRSSSYIHQNRAVSILDVGNSTYDVEGHYQCVAVDKRGKTTTQALNLYTSLFTKVNSLWLTNVDSDAPQITCSVSGDETLEVFIVVSVDGKNGTRLDTDDRYEVNITRRDGQREVKLAAVPWAHLKVPFNHLTCSAIGIRGDDRMKVDLSRFHGNRRGIYVIVEYEEFHLSERDDGNDSFTCVFSGEQPLDMEMSLMKAWKDEKVAIPKHYPVTKITEKIGDTKMNMTYIIPAEFFNGYNHYVMRCEGKNRHNYEKRDFYLPRYYRKYY